MNQSALHRLLAADQLKAPKKADPDALFQLRLATNLTILNTLFSTLYPGNPGKVSFGKLLRLLAGLFAKRDRALRIQDLSRLREGNWYQSEKIVGMQLYVDHFNKDLKGLAEKLGYFDRLGVNFLHLMPVTTRPEGANDGGYAVNSYSEIDPRLGTGSDFLDVTVKLRSRKIYLMLDFVVNHTSDEYIWAKKALGGNKKYQAYYYTYPDRALPDAFDAAMPDVFPETAPGNFTYREEMQRWVMTVFNRYQWDLNYTNPEVFMEMLTNLIEMVNMGVDVVRFDALAFLWKKPGTNSQNLPEAHLLITLFRMCLQVIAPGVVMLAEAIVPPREIIKYFGEGWRKGNECEIAYNAHLMALLWNSIATSKTNLLYRNFEALPEKPEETTWVNYIRCHDDIGLGMDDSLIREMGWDPREHRKFLLAYYCRKIPWSPAMGCLFMHDPKTGDGRITGSTASLLGLEKAVLEKDGLQLQQAVDKIILMHAIILSCGGIPFIYGGDETGTLNDYSYLDDPDKRSDSRWVNRPSHNWRLIDQPDLTTTPALEIFEKLKHLIAIRKEVPEFADQNNFIPYDTGNPHILVFERPGGGESGMLVLCNFDGHPQGVKYDGFAKSGYARGREITDSISERTISLDKGHLELLPYQVLWVRRL